MGIVIGMQCQRNLLEIVGALHPSSRFASGLNGGQQECDQNSDDRNNNEKFNEGKSLYFAPPPQFNTFLFHTTPLFNEK
jgi:hypothetical protein